MDTFVIHGGNRLNGTFSVHGSKNATLPLMAAALMTDEPVRLLGVPELVDIRNMGRLLESLGCAVVREPVAVLPDGSTPTPAPGSAPGNETADSAVAEPEAAGTTIRVEDTGASLAHYDIVRTMRAGICVLGPLLARRGEARVSMPGGCAIGDRPVDLHLRGLRALGAEITLEGGYIVARTPNGRLRGAHVFLGGPNGSTVLGTANIMSAAVLAAGTTVIECAACEPEIEDLAALLNAMGADIRGAGSPLITVEGVEQLSGATHEVMPDRIEAGTYVIASAITNGCVRLKNFPTRCLTAALDRLEEVGVTVEIEDRSGDKLRDTVSVNRKPVLKPAAVVTQPHPGFPTDLQAQFMALLCLAEGNSIITEKIFPERFLHVAELARMGAHLMRSGPSVMVSGVRELIGAPVMASDLRASAGLVLAALAARGETTINRVYHLDRGYEQMELSLKALGADIRRVNEKDR